ncbi:MAG: NAD-dependent epimerase/dehydratase family protein [Pseudomonadota bacterium]
MRVFLTGSSGYLGTAIAEKLLGRGHRVAGLVRRPGSAPAGVEEAIGNLANPKEFLAGLAEADAVIHTAFDHRADFADAVAIEKAALEAMLSALSDRAIPVVLTSAAGLLGDTGGEPAPDSAPVSPDFPARIRGYVEEWCRTRTEGPFLTAIRLPVLVYGRGGSQFLPLLLETARRDGISRYVGAGTNRLSAVHVDDAASAYVAALEVGQAGGVINLSAETVTGAGLAALIGRAASIDRVESASLETAQAAIHPFAALLLSMNFDLRVDAAKSRLNWAPQGPSLFDDVVTGSYSVAGQVREDV